MYSSMFETCRVKSPCAMEQSCQIRGLVRAFATRISPEGTFLQGTTHFKIIGAASEIQYSGSN